MRKNIKKILALSLIASIFIQVLPVGMSFVEAQDQSSGNYSFQWNKNKSVNKRLELSENKLEETGLVSWNVGARGGSFILEYYIEDERDPSKPAEKIKITFTKDANKDNEADVKVESYKAVNNEERIEKPYKYFDFDSPNDERWLPDESELQEQIVRPITRARGSAFPGGRIRIGHQMEIRYRWNTDDTFYFQTNSLKKGNITPFTLKHETLGGEEKIEVLSGVENYTISPMHIEIDDEGVITNKDKITRPGEERPGSKPGLKVEFNKPKALDKEFIFDYDKTDTDDMRATLDLSAAKTSNTSVSKRISFDLKASPYLDLEENKYTIYLSKDKEGNKIVRWEDLEASMILNKRDLLLSKDGKSLGGFTPEKIGKDIGRYTYLDFDIKKSSFQEAYLEIVPYKGTVNTEFFYIVEYSVDGLKWDELVRHKYMPTSEKEEDASFNVPVPFKPNSEEEFYRVKIEYSQGEMISQTIRYEPQKDLTTPPPVPTIQTIENVYVVPPKIKGDNPEAIGFDISWRAPRNIRQELDNLLEDGKIYYELFLSDSAEIPKERRTHIKTFEASMDEDDNIILKPYIGKAGKENYEESPEVRYNSSNDTFTMENVVLKKPEKDNWEQIVNMPEKYEDGYSYPSYNDKINDKLEKSVPGIYYLSMRALYDPDGEEIQMGLSDESNAKSISISVMKEVVPVPTKIESKNVSEEKADKDGTSYIDIIEEISWDSVNLARYKRQMLDPLDFKLKPDLDSRSYELYLYTNKELEEKEFAKLTPASIDLDVSEKSVDLSENHLNNLRDGKAIRIDYRDTKSSGTDNIRIKNLDPNQVYYMSMRVRLDLSNKDGKEKESRYSIFSKQHSFTSYIRPDEPEPSEKVPPVPGEFKIVSQESNTSVALAWEAPEYKKQDDEKIYYELLKIDSREILKDENSRLLAIEDIVDKSDENEMQAWSTEKDYMQTYKKAQGQWLEASPKQETNRLKLEDFSLNPNSIYYYYIRTVILTEGERVKSSWIGLPVTTDPVKKPIQLKIENKESYKHDPKKEIVISFMAPVTGDESVPSEYDFDIAVQGESDDGYKLDYNITKLKSKEAKENIPEGYTHFTYKIKDLRPGKRYDVKVRVIDKTVDKINNQYPKSLYSDRVTARTSFDQDEQDKEDRFSEYLQYFEDRAEALRRRPYWEMNNKRDVFSVKYRNSYLEPEMQANTSYNFAVKDDSKNYEYYIPAKALLEANLNKTSFQIVQGGITYIIRPETLTKELEEIRETIIDINDKRIRDYYILFSFSQANTIGAGNITPEVELATSLVQLTSQDFIIEDDIMIGLNNLIEKEKLIYIDDLENALERGRILKEDLDPLVDKALENIQEDHKNDVRQIVRRNTRDSLTIKEWNKPMLVIANNILDALAQGYYKGLTKENLPSFRISQGYALEAEQPGIYGFTGKIINIAPLPGAPGSKDLVIKYGLDEFFGYGGYINPDSLVTKRQLLGASAKVLGASKGADYKQYLRQVGLKGVSNIGLDRAISKEEAIYILMQTYEKTLQRPINAVYVGNRNSVANIRQFNQIYQPYVLVAVDSKLISGPVRPNDNIKTSEVLQMLTNILKEQR